MVKPDEIEAVRRRAIGPDFGHPHVVGLTEPAGRVIDVDGNVEVKGHAGPGEVHPLRHRLEIVDGFAALDLDETRELFAGRQDEVREKGGRAELDGRRELVTNIRCDFELPLVLGGQKPDEAIVLELLPDRPDKNGGQTASAAGNPNILCGFGPSACGAIIACGGTVSHH